ncbi:MAG: hypothetical protein P1U41_09225 [Vicingaceae bacterium]|nr:hypothetical protein [Vicingaceae bacterium]
MKRHILLLFAFLIASVISISAQEIAEERITKYVFKLNKIKHQVQVDGVVTKTKLVDNVSNCKLDWLNYQMEIIVKEGGEFGSLSLEKIKAILIENNVDLVKFTKETISK